MLIRRANSADIPAILQLEQRTATAAHWSPEQYQTAFSTEFPPCYRWIGEDETGVQGFIIAKAMGDELEIENLAVHSSARRLGFGTALLRELLQTARSEGIKAIFLEVRESNQSARRFYEKHAFTGMGRRKRYYRGPDEDAMIYRLAIAQRPKEDSTSETAKL
jgi:ribosomal-protein-alanine N-acetyltransferase